MTEKHKSWACQPKASRTSSPPMALCWESQWSVVQLDHDEGMGTMHRMYGTLDAELEVQRAIKTEELTAFPCLLQKAIGLTVVHVDYKGVIDGLCRGESKCNGP